MNKPIHKPRRRPKKLAGKLLRIREELGLRQEELVEKLGDGAKQQNISNWEQGIREPDLLFLLRYSELANVCLNVIVDDRLALPEILPSKKPYHP